MFDEKILQLVQKHYPQLAELQLQNELASVGQLVEFKAGQVIMDFGSYIRMVPLLVSGSIKVVREDEEEGKELFLYYIQEGETCSMSFSCCMMNKKSDIRTTAEEDTIIIGIPIKYVDEWMTKYQSWKNFVMRSYDDRLKEMVKTIDRIAFKKMDQRLLSYLIQKSEATNSTTFNITHQKIADDLNASREAISRLLKQMEHEGFVILGRHQIELLKK